MLPASPPIIVGSAIPRSGSPFDALLVLVELVM